MSAETGALTIQLLEWISVRPRSYEETMDAWRSSCPRLSIWEDALLDGLVSVVHVGATRLAVRMTPKGTEILGRLVSAL